MEPMYGDVLLSYSIQSFMARVLNGDKDIQATGDPVFDVEMGQVRAANQEVHMPQRGATTVPLQMELVPDFQCVTLTKPVVTAAEEPRYKRRFNLNIRPFKFNA